MNTALNRRKINPVLRIHIILMRIRIRDPHFKIMDPDPGHFFKIYWFLNKKYNSNVLCYFFAYFYPKTSQRNKSWILIHFFQCEYRILIHTKIKILVSWIRVRKTMRGAKYQPKTVKKTFLLSKPVSGTNKYVRAKLCLRCVFDITSACSMTELLIKISNQISKRLSQKAWFLI